MAANCSQLVPVERGADLHDPGAGNLTSLKEAPVYPEASIPGGQVWLPKFDDYVKLHTAWVADWDKTSATGSDRPVHEALEIMTARLDVSDLRKQFCVGPAGHRRVSFAVPAGEIVVCWAFGCGKTTTLRCVRAGASDIR